MQHDPANPPPAIPVAPLAYEGADPGKRYEPVLIEPGAAIYFPDFCCECLEPTNILYTVRGLRLDTSRGGFIAESTGEKNHFELKVRVCNPCWGAYEQRRKAWLWIGPLIGASAMLTLISPLLIEAFRNGEIWPQVCASIGLGGIGAGLGRLLNRTLVNAFARPPIKISRNMSGRSTIRFRNGAYIELFRRAQFEIPAREAALLRQVEAPPPVQWYCLLSGQPVGPFVFEELRRRVADGMLHPEDPVWADSDTEWVPAQSVSGLIDPSADTGDG